VKPFKFYVFCRCGIQRKRFFPLWDTKEKFFSALGYNREGFPTLWDTTEEDFFRSGIQRRTISGWQTNFVLLYPTMQEIFLPLYPTPRQNLVQCTVSQKNLQHCIPQRRRFSSIVSHNGRYFPPLWDTTEEVFFNCGIQRMRFFSVVGYNGRGFFHFGMQRRGFFPLWNTMEKITQRRMIFLNFKCLSLPSNKKFRRNLLLEQ
jgi:hypothetical protein